MSNPKKKIKYTVVSLFILILSIIMVAYYLIPTEPLKYRNYSNEDGTNLNSNFVGDTLSFYYLNTVYNKPEPQLVDSNGIAMVDVSRRKDYRIKPDSSPILYSPIGMAMYALEYYSCYVSGNNPDDLSRFIAYTNWFVTHQKKYPNMVTWTHDHSYIKYDVPYDWQSAMLQGLVISCLLRRFQITNDIEDLELAELAMKAFIVPIKDGGVKYTDLSGDIWYEEYPGVPRPHVLNGFIFGLFGIYEYYRVTGDSMALKLFNDGAKSIENNIHQYNMGYWSRYDLRYKNFCANYEYHQIHIHQLWILYFITGQQIYKEYALKFSEYLNKSNIIWFKLNFIIDAIERRLTYKGFFQGETY